MKLKVTPEGRDHVWIPDKESLKAFIKSRRLEAIHNFIPNGMMLIGADHDVESVLEDIDNADRLAVFTDNTFSYFFEYFMNMGHSLALIRNEKLELYDIGEITINDLDLWKHT